MPSIELEHTGQIGDAEDAHTSVGVPSHEKVTQSLILDVALGLFSLLSYLLATTSGHLGI